ncbi:hypothetical protein SESBI_32324 [Sesbania bispinosa]|nr:hypothetical protein SESBI_32324 [Sesbania bispinosa]
MVENVNSDGYDTLGDNARIENVGNIGPTDTSFIAATPIREATDGLDMTAYYGGPLNRLSPTSATPSIAKDGVWAFSMEVLTILMQCAVHTMGWAR